MATGRDMRASLVLRFRDGASAGLDRIVGRLNRISQAARRVSLAAGAAAALTIAGPVRTAAAIEGTLRDIAVTSGTTLQSVEADIMGMSRAFQDVAVRWRIPLAEVARAAETLSARGLEASQRHWMVPLLAEISAASGATMDDLAQLSVSLERTMNIRGPEQMRQALRELFRAGQLGGFELRNMARYLPSSASQLALLNDTGMRGVRILGAWMQVARDAGGTVEEVAAAVQQAISHFMSESVIRQMGQLGVNFRGVYQTAQREGRSATDAFLEHMRRLSARDRSKIYDMIHDQNARLAIAAALGDTERMLQIRSEMARTTDETVTDAAMIRLRGLRAEMSLLEIRTTQLGIRLGNAAGSILPQVNAALGELVTRFDELNGRYPGLIDQAVSWGAAALAAVVGVGLLGRGVAMLATGIRFLLWPLAAAIGGIVGIIGIKVALIIGVIAALAAGAYALWRYWDQLGPWFRDLWESVRGYFSGFVDWLSGWAGAAYDGAITVIQGAWDVLRTWFGTLWDFWVREPFERFTAWVDGWTGGAMSRVIERIQSAWRGVGEFFTGLWEGIKSGFEAIWGPIIAAIERVERFFNRGQSEGGPGFTAADQATRSQRLRGGGAQRIEGWDAPDAPLMSRTPWSGEIVVRAAPGAEVVETRSSDRRLPITAPNRGMSYGLP